MPPIHTHTLAIILEEKQMKQILVILFYLFIACNSESERINSDDLRSCNISPKYLEEGIVKKFRIRNGNDEFILYDKVQKQGNFIISQRFDEKFELMRLDKFKVEKESWIMVERTRYGKNSEKYLLEIIKPITISFQPQERELIAELVFYPTPEIMVKKNEKRILKEKSKYEFQEKIINCIKYETQTTNEVIDTVTKQIKQKSKSDGYSLFGKDIGWLYMSTKENGTNVNYELIEILTLKEFENKKKL